MQRLSPFPLQFTLLFLFLILKPSFNGGIEWHITCDEAMSRDSRFGVGSLGHLGKCEIEASGLQLSGDIQLRRLKLRHRRPLGCFRPSRSSRRGDLLPHPLRPILRWPPRYRFHWYHFLYYIFLLHFLVDGNGIAINICLNKENQSIHWQDL